MQKINAHGWPVSPLFIFSTIWIVQIVGHIFLSDSFNEFSATTWYLVVLGMISFVFGCAISSIIYLPVRKKILMVTVEKTLSLKVCYYFFLPVYTLLALLPTIQIFFEAGGSITAMREIIVLGISNGEAFYAQTLYFNYIALLFAVFFVCNSKNLSRKFLIIVCFIGFFAGLSTLGRNILLLFFSSIAISLYLQRKLRFKVVLIVSLVFILLFFFIAVALNKGDSSDGVLEMIIWNFKVYFFNGLAAFNYYVENNYPTINDGILLPNILRHLLGVFGASIQDAPTLYPFVETPLSGNVYTVFFPWYHDGGFIGIAIGFFLMGYVTQMLFLRRVISDTHLYYYCISVYALIMTVFEEQFIRAYPLWILCVFIPFAVWLCEITILSKKRSTKYE